MNSQFNISGCCCVLGPCQCTLSGQTFSGNGFNVTLPDPVVSYEKDDGTLGDPAHCCWNYNGGITLFLSGSAGSCFGNIGLLTGDAICGHNHVVALNTFDATTCRLQYNFQYSVVGGPTMVAIWRLSVPRLSVAPGIYTLPFISVTHGGTRPSFQSFCKVIPAPGDVEVEIL